MDRVFRTIVTQFGLTVVDAAHLCATTPARALGLTGHGVLAAGAAADVAVLDGSFAVVRTLVAGAEVFAREP
jgi:N-acetylglucosamine-6-phosphate deacetylase